MESAPDSSLDALNPFSPGAGRQPEELVGRTPELERMKTIIARTKLGFTNRGLIFSGLRGVGKTVLLLRMTELTSSQEFLTLHIEATGRNDHDREALLEELQRAVFRQKDKAFISKIRTAMQHVQDIELQTPLFKIGIAAKEQKRNEDLELELAFEEVSRTATEHHSGVFVFIDEFQEMDDSLMGTLIGLQHRLGQFGYSFYIIGAGLPNLPGVLTTSRSYAERLFEYWTIGQLDAQATIECLQETAQRVGRRFTDDAIAELLKVTKGYPYFIQAYGEAAFNKSTSSPIPKQAVLDGCADALTVLDHGLYESRWQRANKLGREYMHTMAGLGEDTCETSAIAQSMNRSVSDLSRARKSLIDLGLIYAPERGKVAFTVPGMADYINRADPGNQTLYENNHKETASKQ